MSLKNSFPTFGIKMKTFFVILITFLLSIYFVMGIPLDVEPQIDRMSFHYEVFGRMDHPQIGKEKVVVKTLEDQKNYYGLDGASPMKNTVKGPSDMGIYFINAAGRSCGGLNTATCSHNCGALGYPVYWCYPKVCYCHYGSIEDETNDVNSPFDDTFE